MNRSYLREFLGSTRRERVGTMVLVFLICIAFLVPEFLPRGGGSFIQTDTAWIAGIRKLQQTDSLADEEYGEFKREFSGGHPSYRKDKEDLNAVLFKFDPNQLSFEEWKMLGLKDRTIQTILKFIARGGKFRKAQDLQRIYGLSPAIYARLEPYISIPNSATNDSLKTKPWNSSNEKNRLPVPIDINTADTTAFISLPGIGSKLAGRIVGFREKLGGFYSVDQVAETFGLADSVFRKLKPWLKTGSASVKKININTATVEELRSHPYIRQVLARTIVAYRNEHGPFHSVDDLKKIMAVTDEIYLKMMPYLAVQQD